MSIVDRILRIGEGRTLRKLSAIADQVDALEDDYRQFTDEELRNQTKEFRERLEEGEPSTISCLKLLQLCVKPPTAY